VELAVSLLSQPPSQENRNLREWAIEVMDRYSGVPLSDKAKEDLHKTGLSTIHGAGALFIHMIPSGTELRVLVVPSKEVAVYRMVIHIEGVSGASSKAMKTAEELKKGFEIITEGVTMYDFELESFETPEPQAISLRIQIIGRGPRFGMSGPLVDEEIVLTSGTSKHWRIASQ
jgi:hypothetical protein